MVHIYGTSLRRRTGSGCAGGGSKLAAGPLGPLNGAAGVTLRELAAARLQVLCMCKAQEDGHGANEPCGDRRLKFPAHS